MSFLPKRRSADKNTPRTLVSILLMLGVLSVNPVSAAAYRYYATTADTISKTKSISAGGIAWSCRTRSCRSVSNISEPSVSSCKALVQKVGRVTVFGNNRKKLSQSQLSQCNLKYKKASTTRSVMLPINRLSTNIRPQLLIRPKKSLVAPTLQAAKLNSRLRPGNKNNQRYTDKYQQRKANQENERPVNKGKDRQIDQDKDPTGPNVTMPIDLISALVSVSEIETDFKKSIGWFHQIFPDSTATNIYYYMPSEYRISRAPNPKVGFNLKFTYGYDSETSGEALVSLNVTLSPPHREGDLKLLNELVKHSVQSKQSIELKPFPMRSAKIDFTELQDAFDIKPENISIISPNHVRDPVQLTIRMKETDKEEFITHLRNIGLAGRIIVEGETADLEIPIKLGFSEYSGPVVSLVSEVGPGKPVKNMGPFPVSLSGFVAYSIDKNSKLIRNDHPFKRPVRLLPGGRKAVPDLMKSVNGDPILAWFSYEQDLSCQSCLDAVEKQILAVAGLTSKDILNVEAIPTIFNKFDIFKVIVEVKSSYFDPGSKSEKIKNISLKESVTSQEISVYIDRDQSDAERKLSFRYKPIMNDGSGPDRFSRWFESNTLDITITAAQINEFIDG